MKTTFEDRLLPNREICYAYAVAMFFAQQFENNLRAILFTSDYHGMIEEIRLEDNERFKDSDALIDKATCGRLLRALRESKFIQNKKAEDIFNRACEHRNKLAHNFFTFFDFDTISESEQDAVLKSLYTMGHDLYGAALITRAARDKTELLSIELTKRMEERLKELGVPNPDLTRGHYAERKKKV